MNNYLELNQSEVMSRVIFLYRLKRAFYSPWAKLVVLAGFAGAMLLIVSVVDVFHNAWQTPGLTGSSSYLFSAILHTGIVVQVILAGVLLSTGLLLRDTIRSRGFFF